MYLDTKLLKR